MKPLSPADQMFLWLEKRQQPMHVAGLQLFSYPEGAGPRYIRDLVEHMRSFNEPQSPFNQRLVSRFGQYFWETDKQFDLDHHFRHRALPKPGSSRPTSCRNWNVPTTCSIPTIRPGWSTRRRRCRASRQ